MNPLTYELDEIKKTVVQLVSAAVLLVGFFFAFDPSLNEAIQAIVVAGFGVYAVFANANATAEDAAKSVQSLVASVLGVVTVFQTVNPSDVETIVSIVALAVPPIWVYYSRNRSEVV